MPGTIAPSGLLPHCVPRTVLAALEAHRIRARGWLMAVILLQVSGCVIYLDYPGPQVVEGIVISSEGQPAKGAYITIWEGRDFLTLFPISYPAAARGKTDETGRFSLSVQNEWPARITASKQCEFGYFEATQESLKEVVIQLEPRQGGC